MLTVLAVIARIVTNPLSNVFQKQLAQHSAETLFIIAATHGLTLLARPFLLTRPPGALGVAIILFGVVMLGIQAYVFFEPPPASSAAAASTALAAYGIFALIIWFLADRRPSVAEA